MGAGAELFEATSTGAGGGAVTGGATGAAAASRAASANGASRMPFPHLVQRRFFMILKTFGLIFKRAWHLLQVMVTRFSVMCVYFQKKLGPEGLEPTTKGL